MSSQSEGLAAEIARGIRWHALHASMNICSCRAWRATPDAGSLADQHAAHLADALADLLAARDRRVRAEAWESGALAGLQEALAVARDPDAPLSVNPYRIEADA